MGQQLECNEHDQYSDQIYPGTDSKRETDPHGPGNGENWSRNERRDRNKLTENRLIGLEKG